MKLKISQAKRTDVFIVSSILVEAIEWMSRHGESLWSLESAAPDSLQPDVAQGVYFIVYADDEPAATFKVDKSDPVFWPEHVDEDSRYIHRIAVRRKFAREGIPVLLLNYVKQMCVDEGCKVIRLDCDSHRQKLRGLYESMGFKRHSEVQVGGYIGTRYELLLHAESA